jgi:membrane protease YdiL (CAAX protease family)
LTARAFFVAADGRLHAPWRIVLFLVVTALCYWVVALALFPLLNFMNRVTIQETGDTFAAMGALLLAHAVMLRWFDRRPWSYVWLDSQAARPRRLLFGFVTGAAPIAIVSLLLMAVGWLAIVPAPDGPWLRAATNVSLLLLFAALSEELLSRGYLFATLGEWIGWRWAVVLTSVAFGLLHLGNPGIRTLPILTVIIAGLYLAAALLVTKSLYAAWMSHFAWNWVMAVPLHIEVSGLPVPRPDYRTIEAGPDWITGGPWGPEVGVGAVVGMFGGLAYLYWRSRKANEPHER